MADTANPNTLDSAKPLSENINYGGLRFPGDLSSNYYMSLMFYEYQRPDLTRTADIVTLDVIELPIPVNLVDSQSVDFSEEPLGTALGSVAENLPGWNVGNIFAGVATAGVAGAAQKLGVEGALSAGFGVTANPFLTIMFKSPKYRTYEFAWRLFPKNEDEANTVKKIYQTLKYHALPERFSWSGGALLKYPDMIKPVIFHGGNMWMFPFKYGVITSVTFNFAPDGVPSFHKKGHPTAVDVRIAIQEIEYFLKSDFRNLG